MFSRNGGVCTINLEFVVENIKKSMRICQRLLRSRSELISGAAHIFWYMMDEHMHFRCHPRIMCSHGSHELKCAYIIFESWMYDLTENANHNTTERFEAFNQ